MIPFEIRSLKIGHTEQRRAQRHRWCVEEQRIFMDLQEFGVIPFEIRTLKIGHTEQRRTQRFYIVAIVRHRGTVGAWRDRGYLRVLLIFLFTSFQSSGLQDFLKRLFVYYQSYQQHVHYASVALCAFGTSVRLFLYFHLRVLPLSV